MSDIRLPDLFESDLMPSAMRVWPTWRPERDEGAPQIRLDLRETDEGYDLTAEIPGVRKEDIDVRVEGSQVTIAAEVKKAFEEKKGDRVLRSERRHGFASRSFSLAQPVDADTCTARYADGLLQLHLPKKSVARASRLAID